MPMSAATVCRTCGGLRCQAHKRKAWQEKAITTKRTITGRGLQAARMALYVQQNGNCATCGAMTTLAGMVRDHIIPLAEAGPDVLSNTQGLCHACSEAKTKTEALRGLKRWQG
jgi:5-methylcytosine-specific restriction endonuclease McrA